MAGTLKRVDATRLYQRLVSDGEIALLDVREEGPFSEAHILSASNAPLSRFERAVPALVPRRATPVVLVDADESLVGRATDILAAHGYDDVAILEKGLAGWQEAGLPVVNGVYVPSKAFGEFVEHTCDTPHIEPEELEKLVAEGADLVILDGRPFAEYSWITIPGAVDCPNGELVLRARSAIPSEDTLVVVICGGRTRSIIGAQTLIDAGLPNKVVSLKNGTQGWHLSGREVACGQDRVAPAPDEKALSWARSAAARLRARFGVETIDAGTLERFEAEAGERTLYRFDVRLPEEHAQRHRPGFRSVPGGQLVQATDTFLAVRAGRIVLADSDGVRATVAASWLVRMGFPNVFVLDHEAPWEAGEEAPDTVLGLDGIEVESISAQELAKLAEDGRAVVVDTATSREYRKGHIPGAWFAVRGRLDAAARLLPASGLYVVTSPDGVIARLAAPELAAAVDGTVKVLSGGTRAWMEAGHALETTPERLASETDDVALKAFEKPADRENAMRDYLKWEVDLVARLRDNPELRFRL